MHIRKAEPKDIVQLLPMGKAFYDYAGLAGYGLKWSEESAVKTYEGIMSSENAVMFVAEEDEEILGVICGMIGPWVLDHSQSLGQEEWWWVKESARGRITVHKRLRQALMDWVVECGGQFIIMALTMKADNHERLERYYKKTGFETLEKHYIREVTSCQ